MNEEILELVRNYQRLVNTQDRELFDRLFSCSKTCSLISVTRKFIGKESIYQDFLIDRIRHAYTKIELINDGIEINQIDEDLAIVIFQYHTECVRRDDGSEYGIAGLETQVVIREAGQWKLLHIHYSK